AVKEALPPGRTKQDNIFAPLLILARESLLYLGKSRSLPISEADFPPVPVYERLEPMDPADYRGGLDGSAQVAAVNCRKGYPPHSVPQPFSLPDSLGAQRQIHLSDVAPGASRMLDGAMPHQPDISSQARGGHTHTL